MQQDGGGDSGPKSVASQRRGPECRLGQNLPQIASLAVGPTSGSTSTLEATFSPPLPTVPTQVV